METFWLVGGKLVAPSGIVEGAVQIVEGRIASVRLKATRSGRRISVRGQYVTPGFIDLHVWGPPARVAQECVRAGTTAFLTALGPEAPAQLLVDVAERSRPPRGGARCLGVHLEGPFLNPVRGGVLPRRWMRAPTIRELAALSRAAGGRIRLITLAPELSGASSAIAWCRRHRIVVSLGHSDADARIAEQAVRAGARAVTHLFNGMRPFHHRQLGLVGVGLTEPRLTAMVIADGAHVSPGALWLASRSKGAGGIALVTDSVRSQRQAWKLHRRAGAYHTREGTLAGSRLTMIDAVRNMVECGGASLVEAVTMATETPARLLGLRARLGGLRVGAAADVAVFDRTFCATLTLVDGHIAHQR